MPVHGQTLSQCKEGGNAYLHTDLLAAIRTLLLMLNDSLIITAVDVQSDNSIQRNANP